MPPTTFPRLNAPLIGEPAKIMGMTIIVVVQCRQCDKGEELGLLNAQPAVCPSCGALVALDRVEWDKKAPRPTIELTASPPRGQSLQ